MSVLNFCSFYVPLIRTVVQVLPPSVLRMTVALFVNSSLKPPTATQRLGLGQDTSSRV